MKLADIIGGGTSVVDWKGGCSECPRARKDFVPATITDSDLLIVGEAPGATEVEEGEGFTGRSGQYLRSTLEKYGITEYSLSNSILCRPPDNRNPYKKELSCCGNQFLKHQIPQHSTVALFGRVPVTHVFPDSKYAKMRGHVAWNRDFPGVRFFSALHPAYILRRQDKGPEFERQVARLSRILEEDPGNPPWEIISSEDSSSLERLQSALDTGVFAFDIETNGLESWHPDKEMVSFSLCANTDEAFFFHKNDPKWEESLDLVRESLGDSGTIVVAHNAGFDLEWLERNHDINLRCQIADTQSLYYLLYMGEDYRKARMRSLKGLVGDELDGYRYLLPNPHEWTDINLLKKYNTEDVIRTLQLFRQDFPKLTDKQRDLFFRVASPSSLAARRLNTNGLYVDTEYAASLKEELDEEKNAEIEKWKEEDPEFDPEEHISGDGFIDYVYSIRDLPVITRTEKDQKPATDKDTIKELIRDHGADFLEHRLEYQRIDKQISTFVEPYASGKVLDPYTERVRSDFLNCFTRTGRTSSRNMNVQNIPRDPIIRKLFGAPPGKVFLEADLSQIEIRIAMSLAKDPVGLEAYQKGSDLHAQTAQKMAERKGMETFTKEMRSNAKVTNFSLLFRGSVGTVKNYAFSNFGVNYTWDEAEEFYDTFFSTYTELSKWHQEVVDELRQNRGRIETALGFQRYLDWWDSPEEWKREKAEREAINFTVQSNNAFITLLILYLCQQKIRERGLYPEVMTVNTVHDSCIFEVPENMVDTVIEIGKEATAEVEEWISDWFLVPLVMDFACGPSWGELEELNV